MDQRVTQCPRCGTSFRVTEAHLAVAAGAVRCGSCLHIFNARDHWADQPAKPAARPAAGTGAAAKTKPAPAPEVEIDDDQLIDDDTPLFDDDEDEKASKGSIFNPEEEDFGEAEPGAEKLSDSFTELNSWEEDTGSAFREARPEPEQPEDSEADEQWARRLLEEEEQVVQSAPARSALFEDYGDTFGRGPDTDAAQEDDPDEIIFDLPDSTPLGANQRQKSATEAALEAHFPSEEEAEIESIDLSMTPLRADDRIGDDPKPRALLNNFDPEPLQLHQFVRESRWPRLLWGGGLVFALILLLGQYLYFNFEGLARGAMRPYLAQACAIFTCSLPTQSDIARVRTSSLIVRSHPTHKGALAVDAILTNQAPFAQPYPILQLQFTDLNGAAVAGRQFTPEEYLGGELTGSRLMPAQQPVHIALELVDPGPRAVNYLLTVVATAPAGNGR